MQPIPESLWQRFAALDARCDYFLTRRTEWRSIGADGTERWTSVGPLESSQVTRRAWYVRIALREGEIRDMVHVVQPTLLGAMEAAVTEAEHRGWSDMRGLAPA